MKRKNQKNTGLDNGTLNSCPSGLNCVCSQYPADEPHYLKPFKYEAERKEVLKTIVETLKTENRAEIIDVDEDYLHATFTIPIFGFVDDVEFFLPFQEKVIHFRSASRVGYSDLGANKRRMKKLKRKFKKAGLSLL